MDLLNMGGPTEPAPQNNVADLLGGLGMPEQQPMDLLGGD